MNSSTFLNQRIAGQVHYKTSLIGWLSKLASVTVSDSTPLPAPYQVEVLYDGLPGAVLHDTTLNRTRHSPPQLIRKTISERAFA